MIWLQLLVPENLLLYRAENEDYLRARPRLWLSLNKDVCLSRAGTNPHAQILAALGMTISN